MTTIYHKYLTTYQPLDSRVNCETENALFPIASRHLIFQQTIGEDAQGGFHRTASPQPGMRQVSTALSTRLVHMAGLKPCWRCEVELRVGGTSDWVDRCHWYHYGSSTVKMQLRQELAYGVG